LQASETLIEEVSVLGRRSLLSADSVGIEVAELLRSKRLVMELRSDLEAIIMFCCLLTTP
jgi:hypothetical protein